jgi:hypothetical protein
MLINYELFLKFLLYLTLSLVRAVSQLYLNVDIPEFT